MKKIYKLVFVCLAFILCFSKTSYASSSFNVIIEGKNTKVYDVNLELGNKAISFDYKPYIYSDRTFVPIRLVAEYFNSKVLWDQKTKSVLISNGSDSIIIYVDSSSAIKNGEPISLGKDSIPRLVGYSKNEYKTMVPLRVVTELLGHEVSWNQEKRAVNIKQKQQVPLGPIITFISKENGSSKNEQIKLVGTGNFKYTSLFEEEKNAVSIDISGATFNIGGKTSGKIEANGQLVKNIEYSSDLATNTSKLRVQLNRIVEHKIKQSGDGKSINISFTNLVTGIRPIEFQFEGKSRNAILIENVQSNETNVIKLKDPFRCVIDIKDASFISEKTAFRFDIQAGFVSGVRANQFIPDGNYSKNDNIVRVVLDSKSGITDGEVKIIKSGADMVIIPLDSNASNTTKPITDTSKIPNNPINNGGNVDQKDSFDNVEVVEVVERKPRIKPNSKKEVVIVLDPGHGGKDSGAIAEDIMLQVVKEKDLNLDIALRVEKLLISYGYTVIMTRGSDKAVNIYDRPVLANKENAHAYISIHANSSPNEDATGIETLYAPRDATSVKYDEQYPLAKKIHERLIAKTSMFNRGTKQRADLIVLKHTEMVAALVELGFMSNFQDLNTIQSEEFKQLSSSAIAEGIIEYINESYGY